ncbi:MAG: efflux RND transporter periplasmic adaptor subunit, partial [Myxococcota bacterium]
VAAVHVDEGDSVERGALLVELDRDRMEYRVAELEAALQMERARASEDLVGRANAEEEQAQLDLARAERLHEKGVLSIQRLEEARHAARLARIFATDARAGKSVRIAAVRRAEEELRRARSDLSKSIIHSPIDGVVVRRGVEVGAAVADVQNGGTVVVVLADDRSIHLRAQVSESDIARVQVGQRAEILVDAFPDETVEGTVRKISSSGTLNRGASEFEIEVELASDPRLRVGMTADARIVVNEHRDVLLVPTRGIVSTPDGPSVRAVSKGNEDRPELRPIHSVYSDGFQAVVTEGLSEGDLLLVRSP